MKILLMIIAWLATMDVTRYYTEKDIMTAYNIAYMQGVGTGMSVSGKCTTKEQGWIFINNKRSEDSLFYEVSVLNQPKSLLK